MKKIKSAKQLTFTYFSIVAFAIIAIHFSVFDSTLEGVEQLNAQNRLIYTKQIAQELLADSDETDIAIPPYSHAYIGQENLPDGIVIPDNIQFDQAFEVASPDPIAAEYFMMKTRFTIKGEPKDTYLLHFDEIYEISEEQMFWTQTKQLSISFALLIITLIVVLRISERLTSPFSQLTDELKNRSPHDLSPINLPPGTATKELLQLVDSLNQYQAQIHDSIERERSFNRYASHELRTPLMVIKGAISLLGQSNEPAFIEKQRNRLLHASNEMNDFVTTLLSLTRDEDLSKLSERSLDKKELQQIVSAHKHLLNNKSVVCEVIVSAETKVKIPETTLKILIGNLIKNAFACTDDGKVTIYVSPQTIKIIDSGIGLGAKPRGIDGYGLGLVIANDICRKYGWLLDLTNNENGGCTAIITLQQG
ncbi:HAMP domain-containing sensor histidine kinase [Photobacterium sp.]|uniref:sensor histidine kinase n=1 Tax=Photobacterium sp. TaxID=660 RepID=UPI00299CFE8C|nr:HAMP domain-containing sensor histidine kinase [Photobacterium sp.]MDX1302091.1 HAMP domain-containing sensor histidine kinase [Photobacterium sp.]